MSVCMMWCKPEFVDDGLDELNDSSVSQMASTRTSFVVLLYRQDHSELYVPGTESCMSPLRVTPSCMSPGITYLNVSASSPFHVVSRPYQQSRDNARTSGGSDVMIAQMTMTMTSLMT